MNGGKLVDQLDFREKNFFECSQLSVIQEGEALGSSFVNLIMNSKMPKKVKAFLWLFALQKAECLLNLQRKRPYMAISLTASAFSAKMGKKIKTIFSLAALFHSYAGHSSPFKHSMCA